MKELYYYLGAFLCLNMLYASALAAESDEEKYQHCMALVESNAEQSIVFANDWIISGLGGVAAKHCKALGLFMTGEVETAAGLLEKLVEDLVIASDHAPETVAKNARLKVQIYAQAALAWQQAGENDKAYMAYSSALSGISPEGPYRGNSTLLFELYLDRGTLQILRRQYMAAVGDLTLAIEEDDRRYEGYLQRAKAYRKSRDYLKARLDLKVAAKIAVDNLDILLESGILYREQGKKLKARGQWQKIIDLDPQSEEAALARSNLELLLVE